MSSDRTPNDLADALDRWADWYGHPGRCPYEKTGCNVCDSAKQMRAAAVLLRRQGEQLDTLRAAIGEPRHVENMYVQANCGSEVAGLLDFLRRVADAASAVAQEPQDGIS